MRELTGSKLNALIKDAASVTNMPNKCVMLVYLCLYNAFFFAWKQII